MLSKKAKDDLRQIIKKDYGHEINDDQAEDLGGRLLRLARLVRSSMMRRYAQKEKAD